MSSLDYELFLIKVSKDLERTQGKISKRYSKESIREVKKARDFSEVVKGLANDKANEDHLVESQRNAILDSFYPDRRSRFIWRPLSKRDRNSVQEINLNGFSLIDNPEDAIGRLLTIAKAETEKSRLFLNFLDGVCYDISPLMVFSLMQNSFPLGLFSGGRITEKFSAILSSLGLAERMKIVTQQSLGGTIGVNPDTIFSIKFSSCEPTRKPTDLNDKTTEGSEYRKKNRINGQVTTEMVDKLDEWVRVHGEQEGLSNPAKGRLRKSISEMIENGFRHAGINGNTGEWHAAGLLQLVEEVETGAKVAFCNISIVSIGATIKESLQDASTNIKKEIEDYVSLHKEHISEECLWNVYALQDFISCDRKSKIKGKGFCNAMTAIFNELFDHEETRFKPSFTIISGNSWVKAAFPYNFFRRGGERRTLAFNPTNDLGLPPDKKNVRLLSAKFPGTIISIRFFLKIENLHQENIDDPS